MSFYYSPKNENCTGLMKLMVFTVQIQGIYTVVKCNLNLDIESYSTFERLRYMYWFSLSRIFGIIGGLTTRVCTHSRHYTALLKGDFPAFKSDGRNVCSIVERLSPDGGASAGSRDASCGFGFGFEVGVLRNSERPKETEERLAPGFCAGVDGRCFEGLVRALASTSALDVWREGNLGSFGTLGRVGLSCAVKLWALLGSDGPADGRWDDDVWSRRSGNDLFLGPNELSTERGGGGRFGDSLGALGSCGTGLVSVIEKSKHKIEF